MLDSRAMSGARTIKTTLAIVVSAYIVAIGMAEVTVANLDPVTGVLLHSILLVGLLSQYVFIGESSYRRIFPVLALAALLRILSLAMPITQMSQISSYVLVGVPLFLAIGLTLRLLNLTWDELGVRVGSAGVQVIVAISGVPLGAAAFLIARPQALSTHFSLQDLVINSAVLIVFVAVLEEIIFRGLLQTVVNGAFGRGGNILSSLLFAIMYSGSLSWRFVLFMGSVSLFFGWCFSRTESITGIIGAHSLLIIGALLVWPLLLTGDVPERLVVALVAAGPPIVALIHYLTLSGAPSARSG